MRNHPFNNFKYGIFNRQPPETLPDGAASDSLNWITTRGADGRGKIELIRGYTVLGTENQGRGRITGLGIGKKADGTEIPFITYDRKLKYYDEALLELVEIGTNALAEAMDGKDVTFAPFISRAGAQLYLNSPYGGPYKIMTANPGSVINMYDNTKNYPAYMAIHDNRAYNWQMDNKDKTAVRQSYIEVRGLSDFTEVSGESVTNGNAVAIKSSKPKATIVTISGTGGGEAFIDDQNGILTGASGGTGTINYTTGVVSFTKSDNTVPVSLTVTYRYVDDTENGGIANFVVPGSRNSGDPNVFQQLKGGETVSMSSLQQHKFIGHKTAVWDILPSLDDTETTNTLFRETLGIPSLRAMYPSAKGIFTIDLRDPSNPRFCIIQYASSSTDIKPVYISDQLSLIDYNFDDAVVFGFFDYILFACKTNDSPVNNRVFIYNTTYRTFDLADYNISVMDLFEGTLLAGDSLTNNLQRLFSGLSANESVIRNYWIGGISEIGYTRLKKVKRFLLEGDIGPDQAIRVYASVAHGPFVEIVDANGGPFIQGNGDYVDRSQRVTVGALTLGMGEIAGGSNGIEAYHYARALPFRLGKFDTVQLKFVADNVGYASITLPEFRDIRLHQDKPMLRYRDL